KTEHSYQALGEFNGIRSRMMARRSSGDSRPDLLKPLLIILSGNYAQHPSRNIGSSVTAGFALHEDEFDVILNNGIRLVGFSKKAGAIFDLMHSIRNFVPDNRRQIIEAKLAAMLLNCGMERDNGMPSIIFPA